MDLCNQLSEIRNLDSIMCKKYYEETHNIYIKDYSNLFSYDKINKLISENICDIIKSCNNNMIEQHLDILCNDIEFVTFLHQHYVNLEYSEFMSKTCNLIYNLYFIVNINHLQRSVNDRYVAKLDKKQNADWTIIDKFMEYIKSSNYDHVPFDEYSGLFLGPKPAF